MIYGIGTDIVRVARMGENLNRFGDRFVQRILTDQEQADFAKAPHKARFLAKRFAAKEAAVKAMGLGFRDGMTPRQIGVGHDANGRPMLVFHARAEELRISLGIGACHLSLSDEEDLAIAFVTLLAK